MKLEINKTYQDMSNRKITIIGNDDFFVGKNENESDELYVYYENGRYINPNNQIKSKWDLISEITDDSYSSNAKKINLLLNFVWSIAKDVYERDYNQARAERLLKQIGEI